MDLVAGRAYPFERRPIRHIDLLLLAATFGLAVAGLLMVYSATRPALVATGVDPRTYLKRQVTFVGIGAVAVMVAAVFDYRFLKVYAGLVYAGSLALLVLVRTPLGTTVKGSQRWFQLAGFQFAPSELAKLALVV
ncbi:MAG TPA: FtsW/RodA/SpoVE family cell cycle protein, partial [Actinomycetota bacterium]|nr:FtsW/RodA/SpoVE family cell cycle protein [Actinomycetota bacterium]